MKDITKQELFAFGFGILLGMILASTFIFTDDNHGHFHGDTHQITQPDEEYHVHADFLIYVDNEKIDLSRSEFMTTSEQELHSAAHLHDENGEILHLHAPGITFVEFLASLGITVTEDCLTLDSVEYCADDENILALYVNNEPYNDDLTKFEPMDDDALLLYFGDRDSDKISEYLTEVKDDACFYSGTCPERGVAPPESCGLTCEI